MACLLLGLGRFFYLVNGDPMKINSEISSGLRGLTSLCKAINMILLKHDIPVYSRSAAVKWYGFYIGSNKPDFFVGVYLDYSDYLSVNTEIDVRIDYLNGDKQLMLGRMDGKRWGNYINFVDNDVYIDDLENFLIKSIGYMKSICDNVSF